MATVFVSTSGALTSAIAAAAAGDIISCAPGSYGALNISRVMTVGGLTITSTDQTEANRAVFSQVVLNGSDRITLSYLYFDYVRSGTIDQTVVEAYDAKRISLLFNIFDGDYGTEGCGWGRAVLIIGNTVGVSLGHAITGNTFRKFNYCIQILKTTGVLIQGNRSFDVSNDHMQFSQVEDVDVIHNYMSNSRMPAGSLAHPDAGQVFTTNTTVPSKRVKRLRNICDFSQGTFTEGFFANNEIFNGGNTSFRYEGFEYRDNWMKCNHLECITIHGANGVIIEGNQIIAAPLDMSDPFNASLSANQPASHVVWIPRINVLNTIGAVSVQGNRFWAGAAHSGSRLVFTGSTEGFAISDNLMDINAPGPAMPTFTLGGDGLTVAVIDLGKTTASRMLEGNAMRFRNGII